MKIIQHRAQDAQFTEPPEAMEVDVMMTADRAVVCRHDHIYEGKPVWTQNYTAAMGPLLEDFSRGYTGILIVEIKLPELHWADGVKEFEEEVLILTRFHNRGFCSFSPASLHKIRRLQSDSYLIANTHDERLPDSESNLKTYADAVAAPLPYFNNHEQCSLPLYVYTVNSPDALSDRLRNRLEGVFTDHPEVWK